jgi:hypothetical protein
MRSLTSEPGDASRSVSARSNGAVLRSAPMSLSCVVGVGTSCAASPLRRSRIIGPASPPFAAPSVRLPSGPRVAGDASRGSVGPGRRASSRSARFSWRSRSTSRLPIFLRSSNAISPSIMFAIRRRRISIASRGPASLNGEWISPRRRRLAWRARERIVPSGISNAGSLSPSGVVSSPAAASSETRLAGRMPRSFHAEATASVCSLLYLRSKAGTRARDHARRVGCVTFERRSPLDV